MNLLKYAAKLQKMSLPEISFRLRQKGIRITEGFICEVSRARQRKGMFLPAGMTRWRYDRAPFSLTHINFFGLVTPRADLGEIFRTRFPVRYTRFLQQARDLLEHRFHFLGQNVTLPGKINWNRHPLTGIEYPRRYYAHLNVYDTATYGDIKYAWELNRHQFFIELGKAYFLTGEEKFVEELCSLMDAWIEENPYKIGVNWTSVLEPAVRIFSWIWAYAFSQDSPVWTSERKHRMLKSLLMQAAIIEENLSYYYSPYNHLIGELAALAFLGTVYPQAPRGKFWRDHYWQEMEAQLPRQFHSDGMSVEQASYYHHFTLGFYLMLAVLRKQNNLPISDSVWRQLEQILEFSLHLTRPDGRLPMIGDIDSARSIYFYKPGDMWNLRFFLALGAVLFGRPDMKWIAGDPGEEMLWLLGKEGLSTFDNLPATKPASESRNFRKSGYFLMRSGWDRHSDYCCFDYGEIADGLHPDDTPSAAHGHGDILSFEICLAGKPLIIDPGFHTYFGPESWHRYFRETRGHNTVEVNGCGQAIHAGRISWSNVSSPRLLHQVCRPGIDFISAEIDRFAGLEPPVQHRRHMVFLKGAYFLLIDEIFNSVPKSPQYRICSYLHFSPGNLSATSGVLYRDGRPVGYLLSTLSPEVRIEVGGDEPHQGWIARGYGQKEPAPVVTFSWDTSLPLRYGMLFPCGEEIDPSLKATLTITDEGVFCFQIKSSRGVDSVFFNPRRKVVTIPVPRIVKTDALCTVLREESDEPSEFCFIKTGFLKYGQEEYRFENGDREGIRIRPGAPQESKIEIWNEEVEEVR